MAYRGSWRRRHEQGKNKKNLLFLHGCTESSKYLLPKCFYAQDQVPRERKTRPHPHTHTQSCLLMLPDKVTLALYSVWENRHMEKKYLSNYSILTDRCKVQMSWCLGNVQSEIKTFITKTVAFLLGQNHMAITCSKDYFPFWMNKNIIFFKKHICRESQLPLFWISGDLSQFSLVYFYTSLKKLYTNSLHRTWPLSHLSTVNSTEYYYYYYYY